MPDEPTKAPELKCLLGSSLLFRQFQAQREEILKHKWYESEKAGYDIGFERALTDWTLKHRTPWLRAWRAGLTSGS
jgi:hypothetical protein